jgi:small subunit ribosomal protein S6
MAKNYELTVMIDSQLPEEGVEETVKRYEGMIVGQGGEVVNIDRWGARKLAYEVRKQQQAVYAIYQFRGESDVLSELDRSCKLDESVLRHMVVAVDEDFQVDDEEEEPQETPAEAEETEEVTAEEAEEKEEEGEDGPTEDGEGGEDEEQKEDEEVQP